MRPGDAVWYQTAFVQSNDPVATPRKGQIMSNKNRGQLMRTMQAGQQVKDHLAGPEVQIAGRFVGQQNGGSGNQSPSQHHPLLFPPDNSPARCDVRA